jgi:Flp pilus assembly protein CpaB
MDVSLARTFSRPGWLNLRTTLGLILFCLALLAGQRVMAQSASTVRVWEATRDLGPNSTLASGDLRLADVHLSSDMLQRYAAASKDVMGSTLVRAVAAGEILPLSSLASDASAAQAKSMTLPVTPEHAVGGQLRPGDRVDIFASFDSGDVSARTTLVARSVAVIDIVNQGGFGIADGSMVGITVAVAPSDAPRLAFASHNADFDVVRVNGVDETSAGSTVRARDFR